MGQKVAGGCLQDEEVNVNDKGVCLLELTRDGV